jgi:hypothetical protein
LTKVHNSNIYVMAEDVNFNFSGYVEGDIEK